ncbi:cell division protein FtsI (penicillin-binding protein 3) [Rhodoblastus acidophilus]|uniref:peptidoglycan D,D-transpeptidase FtsI family protein n=1 Tax=Rhodoblastus acidophilus TaxID=1074 RepID=UPI002224BDEA|nr:penicillin-binding protein 2 [Rhodoblastus acidophilus]MCW2283039.1 cell division protein FtsI (penicillin-binding protein 3) [Rhodoblastus acidophilus]MCW2331910.1 cell division protein FtsI (penicillin-binding protein 3) [Rhodoblastus acidophilus]
MRSAAARADQPYYEPPASHAPGPQEQPEPVVAPIAVEAAPPPPRKPPPFFLRRSFWGALFSTNLGKSRSRIRFIALLFSALFCVFVGRLAYLGMTPNQPSARREAAEAVSAARPDLTDRNGEVLATDVKVMSVFAEPRSIVDKDEAVEQLTAILPDLNASDLRERLGKKKGFVWVKREVTPAQQHQIFRLGLPGVGFLPEHKRVYPNGRLGAHIVGFTNADNNGLQGVEKFLDDQGLGALRASGLVVQHDLRPVALSLDMRATHAVRDELAAAMDRFHAKAAGAAILDVNTGEVVAAASLPDYDPNDPRDAQGADNFNRLTYGVFEMGSTFKALTLAMALDSGRFNLNSSISGQAPLHIGRNVIHDSHNHNRMLTLPEVFKFSSNVGTARLALTLGPDYQKAFLKKMGQLDRMRTELPESREPMQPRQAHWSQVSSATIAFGHGLAVAPLQAMMAVGALVNGGYLVTPTFLKRPADFDKTAQPRVIRAETSEALRYIMRLNAEAGTARKANIPGYFVGGKTGTAEKVFHGRYDHSKLFTTFMAVVPADQPRYLFLTVMDEPQRLPGEPYATAAYNSGYVTGRLIERISPLLGLQPRIELPAQPFPLLARMGYGFVNQPAKSGGED